MSHACLGTITYRSHRFDSSWIDLTVTHSLQFWSEVILTPYQNVRFTVTAPGPEGDADPLHYTHTELSISCAFYSGLTYVMTSGTGTLPVSPTLSLTHTSLSAGNSSERTMWRSFIRVYTLNRNLSIFGASYLCEWCVNFMLCIFHKIPVVFFVLLTMGL